MRHISAVADPALNKPLGIELIVGAHHTVARNRQRRRQVTAGGQPRATDQTAVQHPLAQRFVQLAGQPLAAIQLNAGWVER